MDDDLQKQVFDPFITTRPHTIRRFGLGLPLLRQNAAVIWLQRALDRLPISGRPVSCCTPPEVLYAQRAAAYARFSDGTADNNGTPDETVRQILEAWT